MLLLKGRIVGVIQTIAFLSVEFEFSLNGYSKGSRSFLLTGGRVLSFLLLIE